MARQRFIWPDLWTDPEIGRLEPAVQLFFIGCFSNADDEGRLLGDPAYLRSTIFPYQDFGIGEVTEIRNVAVANCANLTLYEADGRPYLAFTKWGDYQKPKYPKPSKLPAPPSEKSRKRQGKASGKPSETLPEASRNDGESLPKPSVKLPSQGWDGLGRDGKDKEELTAADQNQDLVPSPTQARSNARDAGANSDEIINISAAATLHGPALSLDEIIAIVNAFPGADTGTGKNLAPLGQQMPADAFHAVVAIAKNRKNVRNRPGLLRSLLELAIRERMTSAAEARLANMEAQELPPTRDPSKAPPVEEVVRSHTFRVSANGHPWGRVEMLISSVLDARGINGDEREQLIEIARSVHNEVNAFDPQPAT